MFESGIPIGDFELQTFDRMSIICTFCSMHIKNITNILHRGGEKLTFSYNVLFSWRSCSTQNIVTMKIKLRHFKSGVLCWLFSSFMWTCFEPVKGALIPSPFRQSPSHQFRIALTWLFPFKCTVFLFFFFFLLISTPQKNSVLSFPTKNCLIKWLDPRVLGSWYEALRQSTAGRRSMIM